MSLNEIQTNAHKMGGIITFTQEIKLFCRSYNEYFGTVSLSAFEKSNLNASTTKMINISQFLCFRSLKGNVWDTGVNVEFTA